jgi:hypothetical protein
MLSTLVRKFLRFVLILAIILVVLGGLLAATAYFTPWQNFAANYIKGELIKHGFADPQLTLGEVNKNRLVISNLSATKANTQLSLAELRLTLDWATGFPPAVTAQIKDLHYKNPQLELNLPVGNLTASQNDTTQPWQGTWEASGIVIKNAAQPLPALHGKGTLVIEDVALLASGDIRSTDNSYFATLDWTQKFYDPTASQLLIKQAAMPWHEGRVSLHELTVPLGVQRDIVMNVEIKQVSANALMQLLTGNKATATGVVSGVLPVTIKADGGLLVQNGKLQTEAPGTISVMADAIPVEQEQLAMLRDLLQDFRYQSLTLTADSDTSGKLAVKLALEGNNPTVQAGRAVKLNVNFTGDVLDFVQQNVMLLLNPYQLLQQEQHAN